MVTELAPTFTVKPDRKEIILRLKISIIIEVKEGKLSTMQVKVKVKEET